MRILLVEDDDLIGSGVEAGLKQAGFTVDWARDGRQGATALATTDYELLVLDLGLPKLAGIELLKGLRARGNDVPVLVLTARATVADRIDGLAAGADDYLGKPFDLGELIARCRAPLRRAHGRSVEQIHYGDLTVDPSTLAVTRDNERLALTARECTVLVELLSHQGMPLSRARLEEALYGWHQEIESNAIEVHISNLRKKLGHDLIKTIRGVGYLMEKAP
ncbi:response regulator transcription factor [Trinickia caryophylli]|uniref:DNA-binding response regulator, OmpR family, contains REC and winged-helix (WHTH) domain n=1 Tax=Trinickia caryophylli TaxID=28094 RepID=A0A1X7CZQ6_TRICW|nr:response regulator transcription factor [Trinickia caryophylli]PMS13526.1 DNA-binding response regulator [Trinickia caryophylli]TRX13615.1 response regulator transcription factor [Trinickia caryophylli]WQE15193.1 response regulator transcription factor [Trinickia caryophylli]SMF06027.1 DNA-binding response regulator, OmpR family, contains REC and winged-helix (wHTH) domain [Trinickia caryophylli]GLU31068.1 DNA-binding response regulator [Trinickia caryophylli]